MKIFEGQELLEFAERFQTDTDCKKYLSEIKWEKGFACTKCGNATYQERKDHSRTCNKCSHTESSTAGNTVPQGEVRGQESLFHLFRDVHDHQKPIGSADG